MRWSAAVVVALAPPALRRAPLPVCRNMAAKFDVAVDLGDDGGVVEHSLQPFFSSSSLVTVRVPLPFTLEADPIQGYWRVTEEFA